MTRTADIWVNSFFATCCQDLTPESMRDDARVLYAPVSNDPQVTGYCALVLSESELLRAERFVRQDDKSLFIQRRAFRRFCAALTLGSSKSLSEIIFEKEENGRPYLSELPDFWFSFSSCRFGFLGAWSSTHGIGVDVEDRTRDPGAMELARKFFSAAEASAVEGSVGQVNLQTFLSLWCLKEAALKSIGEGLPFGLDAFEFGLNPILRIVRTPSHRGGPEKYNAFIIEIPAICAAMVTRKLG